MMSLPSRVACILIAGFFIVLSVTYACKLNNRKVFWGVGLTAIIGVLILLGLGILRPSWGTETGIAVIVGISTAVVCAITLIYAAEDLHQKKQIKGKKIDTATDNNQLVTLSSRLDTETARKVFAKAIEKGYIIAKDGHYKWTLSKVLLAYMCGRIYCEDYLEKTEYDTKPYWKHGLVEQFPDAELNELFNEKKLGQSRHSRKDNPAPVGFENIDKLFE